MKNAYFKLKNVYVKIDAENSSLKIIINTQQKKLEGFTRKLQEQTSKSTHYRRLNSFDKNVNELIRNPAETFNPDSFTKPQLSTKPQLWSFEKPRPSLLSSRRAPLRLNNDIEEIFPSAGRRTNELNDYDKAHAKRHRTPKWLDIKNFDDIDTYAHFKH